MSTFLTPEMQQRLDELGRVAIGGAVRTATFPVTLAAIAEHGLTALSDLLKEKGLATGITLPETNVRKYYGENIEYPIRDYVGKEPSQYNVLENLADALGGAAVPVPGFGMTRGVKGLVGDLLVPGTGIIGTRSARELRDRYLLNSVAGFGANELLQQENNDLNLTLPDPDVGTPTSLNETTDDYERELLALGSGTDDTFSLTLPDPDDDAINMTIPAENNAAEAEIEKQGNIENYIGYGLAATAALASFGNFARSLGSRALQRSGVLPTKTQITNEATAVKQLMLDQNASIKDALGDIGPSSDVLAARVSTTGTAGAINLRVRDALMTGTLQNLDPRKAPIQIFGAGANSKQRITPYGLIKAYENISAEMRENVDELLDIGNTMSRRSLGLPTADVRSDPDLLLQHAVLSSNPVVKRIQEDYRQIMRAMLRYRYTNGTIDAAEYAKERAVVNYVPEIIIERDENGFVRSMAAHFAPTGQSSTSKPSSFRERGMQSPISDRLPSIASMEQYAIDTVAYVEQNALRRDLVQAFRASPVYKPFFEHVKNGGNLIVNVNGKEVHYTVTDDLLAHSLQFAPPLVIPIANATRKLVQEMTTGPIANIASIAVTGLPVQAIKSMAYELVSSRLTKPAGSQFSWLDATLAPLVEIPRGTMMGGVAYMRASLEASLKTNGIAARMLDGVSPQASIRILDSLANTFESSWQRQMQLFGGGQATIIEVPTVTNARTVMRDLTEKHYRMTVGDGWGDNPDMMNEIVRGTSIFARKMYNVAEHVQSVAINSWRTHYFTKNAPRYIEQEYDKYIAMRYSPTNAQKMANRSGSQRAAAESRRIGGDVASVGADPFARSFNPYWNISGQFTRSYISSFRDAPMRTAFDTSAILAAGLTGVWAVTQTPELAAKWWGQSSDARSRGIPIGYRDGAFVMIPLDPLIGSLVSTFVEASGTFLGLRDGSAYADPARRRAMSDALGMPHLNEINNHEAMMMLPKMLGNVVGSNFPIGVAAVPLNISGYKFDSSKMFEGKSPIKAIKADNTFEPNARADGDIIHAHTQEAISSLMGLVGTMGMQFLRGHDASKKDPLAGGLDHLAQGYDFARNAATRRNIGLTDAVGRESSYDAVGDLVTNKMDVVRKLSMRSEYIIGGGDVSNMDKRVRHDIPEFANVWSKLPEDQKRELITFSGLMKNFTAGPGGIDYHTQVLSSYKAAVSHAGRQPMAGESARAFDERINVQNKHMKELVGNVYVMLRDIEQAASEDLGYAIKFEDLKFTSAPASTNNDAPRRSIPEVLRNRLQSP